MGWLKNVESIECIWSLAKNKIGLATWSPDGLGYDPYTYMYFILTIDIKFLFGIL